MATVTKTRTYSSGDTLTASNYNSDRDEIISGINDITNAQIDGSAAISESKLAFSGSGHGHTGTSDGKVITVRRGYGFYISGAASVANDLSWNPTAPAAQTATRLAVHCQVAPTGASLTVRVYNITQGATVASLTLSAAATDGNTSTMTTAAIAQNDVLRVDCTAIGSSVAGSNISVSLDCTQP